MNGGVDSATLPRAGDQIRQRDLIGSNVQASGRVHAINPEVFDGVAGVDHFRSAVQHILVGADSLGGQRKVHGSAAKAIDCTQRRYFPQVHVAFRSPRPLRVSKVDQASGSVEAAIACSPVQRREIDRIRGKLNAHSQLAVDSRNLSLLDSDIGAIDMP